MSLSVIVDSPLKSAALQPILGSSVAQWCTLGIGSFEWTHRLYNGEAVEFPEAVEKVLHSCPKILLALDPGPAGDAMARRLSGSLDVSNGRIERLFLPKIDHRAGKKSLKTTEWRRCAAWETLLEADRRIDEAVRRLIGGDCSTILGLAAFGALALLSKDDAPSAASNAPMLQITLATRSAEAAFRLMSVNGRAPELNHPEVIKALVFDLKQHEFILRDFSSEERCVPPPPPFTTASLIRAAQQLGLSPQDTVQTALELYNGLDVGRRYPSGLITYPLVTESAVPESDVTAAREYILGCWGVEYIPEKGRFIDAEATVDGIRPVSLKMTPNKVRRHLNPRHADLYELIWRRFVSSQMSDLKLLKQKAAAVGGPQERYTALAENEVVLHRGYQVLEQGTSTSSPWPENFRKGLKLKPIAVDVSRPEAAVPRLSFGNLAEEMNALGLCPAEHLPLAFAALYDRGWIEEHDGLRLSLQGRQACLVLHKRWPQLFQPAFLQNLMRRIANCSEFDGTAAAVRTDIDKLLSGPPPTQQMREPSSDHFYGRCSECGREMILKIGRYGRFLACSDFPRCRHTRPFPIGMRCPAEGCSGEIVERRSREGVVFYACDRYPQCRFSSSQRPVNAVCPSCGNGYMTVVEDRLVCPRCRVETGVFSEAV